MRVENTTMPGLPPRVFRTVGTTTVEARDRFGKLAEFEPTNFAHIVAKSMAQATKG